MLSMSVTRMVSFIYLIFILIHLFIGGTGGMHNFVKNAELPSLPAGGEVVRTQKLRSILRIPEFCNVL